MSVSTDNGREEGENIGIFAPLPSVEQDARTRQADDARLEPDEDRTSVKPDPPRDSFDPEDPPGDRIRCFVEDGQLLIGLPSGSNGLVEWLGVFTVGLMTVAGGLTYYFTAIEELGIDQAVILAVLWLGFLSALGHWISARFRTTVVLIDVEQMTERTSLLGVTWYKEYALAGFSKARLIVAHTQDDNPVYAVSIAALDERPQFGAFLRQKEKEWLVRRINYFLGCDDGLVLGEYLDPTPTGEQWGLTVEGEFFDD